MLDDRLSMPYADVNKKKNQNNKMIEKSKSKTQKKEEKKILKRKMKIERISKMSQKFKRQLRGALLFRLVDSKKTKKKSL